MNKVFLIGTVASDPELRFTQAGQAVLNFRVMTVKKWNDKIGAPKERRDYHSVVQWGKRGEELAAVLVKELPIVVEGELQTSTYDDRDGKKCYKTEVNASNVELFHAAAQGGPAPATAHDTTPAPAYATGNQIPFGAPAPTADPMSKYDNFNY